MPDMVQVQRGRGPAYSGPRMQLGRSQFSLDHQHKTTFDAGELIPYLLCEVLPGDTFTCKLNAFIRVFSPLDAPIMDNISAGIDFWYVPWRILWDNYEYFLGAHDQAGIQDQTFVLPRIDDGGTVSASSCAHYMGVPIGLNTTTERVCSMPFRAYRRIWSDWYRDQNLINEASNATDNGPDSTFWMSDHAGGGLLKSAKKPDYFTTSLPYLQKGTAQTVALTDAPVNVDLNAGQVIGVYSTVQGGGGYYQIDTGAATADLSSTTTTEPFAMYADLSNVGLTINALREAAAVQRLLERDARGGTRMTEIIRSHWGVDVPDYRPNRPEYLGGGSGWINVSPVANTSSTATENQGELFGIGTGSLRASWAKSFVEHGYILGLLRARAEVTYQQGLDRLWSRYDKYDIPWPELAMLGEQEVLNKELFIAGTSADDDVFGYQERYADWRYKKSLVTGKFASDATGSLDYWHLAEDFASAPSLNQTFVEDASPMSRVTVVDTEPDFIIDGFFDLKVARALPVRAVPTLMPARF